ncbi:MAG: hypothetical protein L7U56_12005 [Acidimicrobiales bacterium]|nr:hypothetical protein [Acidimicrobiales bacterium]
MVDPSPADIEFFWDPVCPFAWITSRWVKDVGEQAGLTIDWRFISLRLLNKDKDYATEFPPEYEQGHTAGLRFLRVAAAIRAELGPEPMGALVDAYGESWWDLSPEEVAETGGRSQLSTDAHARSVLRSAGLDPDYASALEDTSWDELLEEETELAQRRAGRDIGTPMITFNRPDGRALSFFGPVISRVPSAAEAVPLWEAVTTLAEFPGFAEMKRSMREVPQLRVIGGLTDEPEQEDWTGGHRRGHLANDRKAPSPE